MRSRFYPMTKKNPESAQLMKLACQRVGLTPMHDHEFTELVCENGKVFVQSLPRKTQERPSINVHLMKRRTVDPILDDSLYDNKKDDLHLNLTLNNSLQDNKHHESFYRTHFSNMFLEHNEGDSCDKNLADSQIVPVNEYANLKLGGASNYLREIPQFATTRNNQCHDHQSSLQQCYQASAPSKRPREDSNTNYVSVEEFSNSKLQEQDLESHRKRENANFSLRLRSPVLVNGNSSTQRNDVTVPTSTTSSSRAKKLINNGYGDVDEGFGNPPIISVETNVEGSPTSAKPPKKSVPDDQSAVCREGEFTANEKLIITEKSVEPRPVASSSFCSSRGASNNPIYNYNLKRRYHEDTAVSAGLSDQNVEEKLENVRKQVPARGGAGTRRKRTADVHNQSEKKRRNKINKKMRALQDLIPNCNKVDKASMLDEAIDYLKTLQFQVQMMSIGAGVCMPQMMMPTGMQQIHAPQMAHFSPMSVGMGMRMHMGAVGCSPPQFLISPIAAATAVPGITQNRIQMPGFAAQPLSAYHPRHCFVHDWAFCTKRSR
ncbi:hypothetical protein ACOSQ3_000677 [Xanthoceras sorbifolium]